MRLGLRGFSLIDSIVSIGIVSVAAVGLGAQVIAQKKSLNDLTAGGQGRALAQLFVQQLIVTPQEFPPLIFSDVQQGESPMGVYVGCYDGRLVPQPTSNTGQSIFVVETEQGEKPFFVPQAGAGASGFQRICASELEVHILSEDRVDAQTTQRYVNYRVRVIKTDPAFPAHLNIRELTNEQKSQFKLWTKSMRSYY